MRHGFSLDIAEMMLKDVKRFIDYLEKHRPATPQTAEATTFTHSAAPATAVVSKHR